MARVKRTFLVVLGAVAFLLFSPIQLAHQLWLRYALHHNVPILFDTIHHAYANILTTVEEGLKALLPEAQEVREEFKILSDEQMKAIEEKAHVHLDPTRDKQFRFFIGKKNGEVVGYAALDVVPGKWGPIHYMLSLEPSGAVKDVMVLEYQEKRGRPVAKRRFLKQFLGKTTEDDIALMKDIRGVTGASISSSGMTNGIRKMVHVFEVIYGGA